MITDATHDGRKVFSKTQFSMLEPPVLKHLQSFDKVTDVVLYGAETHICVKQTAFDLLARGYNVHVAVDSVSSMNLADRHTGLEAMKLAGV